MRFYVDPKSILHGKNTVEIHDKDEVHHIRDVMRLKNGVVVTIFDGEGKEYSGTIKEVRRDLVKIGIDSFQKERIQNRLYKITLFQAIPKKRKMDFIVEKAVELGVDVIIPIITERTVPDISSKAEKKIGRWIRICRVAAKQCGRRVLPLMPGIMDFNTALDKAKDMDLVIFSALDKDAVPLRDILGNKNPKTIGVFVGPEGDFSTQEISKAREQGYPISSLGPLVLKVETAAIYILSSVSYSL